VSEARLPARYLFLRRLQSLLRKRRWLCEIVSGGRQASFDAIITPRDGEPRVTSLIKVTTIDEDFKSALLPRIGVWRWRELSRTLGARMVLILSDFEGDVEKAKVVDVTDMISTPLEASYAKRMNTVLVHRNILSPRVELFEEWLGKIEKTAAKLAEKRLKLSKEREKKEGE